MAQSKIVENIFKHKLNINEDLLKPPSKIKRLHVTKDGDIIDNDQLSNDFVEEFLEVRNQKVLQRAITTTSPCEFVAEIYHPNKEDIFMEFVSMCKFRIDENNTLAVIYLDNIKVFDSTDDDNNDRLIPISYIRPFLHYLKNNNLISDVKFKVK